MTEDQKLKKTILFSSLFLFLFSLTQKCYCTTSSCGDSIMSFLLGWAAIFSGGGFAWLANPFLFISWITLRKNLRISMFASVFAMLISLSFLLLDSIVDNENGGRHQIVSYEPGYWMWAASTIVMLLGTFILMLRYNTRKVNQGSIKSRVM